MYAGLQDQLSLISSFFCLFCEP